MRRSGYTDDVGDNLLTGRWRGMVASASRGSRGQKFFVDLVAALDEMTDKSLTVNELVDEEGNVCALGALGVARNLDMSSIDPGEPEEVAAMFGIAPCLAQETVHMNDDHFDRMIPTERWKAMRAWAVGNIKK